MNESIMDLVFRSCVYIVFSFKNELFFVTTQSIYLLISLCCNINNISLKRDIVLYLVLLYRLFRLDVRFKCWRITEQFQK